MDSFKPVRIGKRMLAAMLVFQALNTLLLVAVLLRMDGSVQEQAVPAAPVLSTPPVAARLPVLDASASDSELSELFRSMLAPLVASYADYGVDPGAMMPSDAELEQALATGSLASVESQVVLDKLRSCYAQQGLPFPRLPPMGGVAPKPVSSQ